MTVNIGGTFAINGINASTGALDLNEGIFDSTGTSSLTAPINISGTDDTINSSGALTINGTINGSAELFLDGTGSITLAGNIGNTVVPANLITGIGSLTIDTNLIKTQNAQFYGSAVQLATATTLTTTNNGTVTFDNNITNSSTTPENLTINTGTGDASFDALGSSGNPLGNLQFNSNGNTTLNDAVFAASYTSGSGGETTIAGGTITTSGAQTYNNALNLDGDTNLTSGTSISVTHGAGEGFNLSMTGNTLTLDGPIDLINVTATGNGSNNSFTLNSGSTQNWTLNNSDTGNITTSGITGTGSYNNIQNITGGSGADTFTIAGGTLSGNVNGGGGNNTLTGDNVANTFTISGANAGTATGIGGFNNVQNLTGGNVSNSFVVAGGSLSGNITGVGGSNTLTGGNTTTTWNITGANSGNLTHVGGFSDIQNITGGNANNTFNFANNATLSGLLNGGSLANNNVLNVSAYNALVNDALTSDKYTGSMTANGLTIVNYTNMNNLSGNGGILTPTAAELAQVVKTGPESGFILDPLFWNGFIVVNAPTPPSPAFVPLSVSPIIQQPSLNDTININPDPTWVAYRTDGSYMVVLNLSDPAVLLYSDIDKVSTDNEPLTVIEPSSTFFGQFAIPNNVDYMKYKLSEWFDIKMKQLKINLNCGGGSSAGGGAQAGAAVGGGPIGGASVTKSH